MVDTVSFVIFGERGGERERERQTWIVRFLRKIAPIWLIDVRETCFNFQFSIDKEIIIKKNIQTTKFLNDFHINFNPGKILLTSAWTYFQKIKIKIKIIRINLNLEKFLESFTYLVSPPPRSALLFFPSFFFSFCFFSLYIVPLYPLLFSFLIVLNWLRREQRS